ncbi:HAD family hydrolase [Rhodoferax sp.]|uniref:HAD family hydrolase n=1 Tax=Rhodoferax sp. TaxID=50421 RepID=UPI0027468F22|nr:HAD family phosphatase [Rhodoferax sp.]
MNLVFDFGAVLFRWQPELLMQAHFAERATSAQAARELARTLFHHPDWQSFDRGAIAEHDLASRTSERLNLQPAAVLALLEGIEAHLTPVPATVALLERLCQRRREQAGMRLFFLSNMPVRFARMLERRHDLANWFDGGVFSGDVHLAKPEPGIYQLLQQRYDLDPARTTFIDDLQANVDAAAALGWRGIRFESASQLEGDLTAVLGLASAHRQ